MDTWLLAFSNQTLANPVLDVIMVLASTVGLAALPLVAYLYWRRGDQQTGRAILLALGMGLVLTVIFYYLAQRPRPSDVRLLLPMPPFPAFPSGHTAVAFATATVLALRLRQRTVTLLAILGALLISFSRIYLGHHYPSDLLGGAVLGCAVGAAAVGLLRTENSLVDRLRWLLWPQLAVVILGTEMAYLDIVPRGLLFMPYADKLFHALLFGAVVFWLNLWWGDRRWRWGQWAIPVAIALPITLALLEEIVQAFSPLRTGDLLDLASDLAGMTFFWWLSNRLLARAAMVDAETLTTAAYNTLPD